MKINTLNRINTKIGLNSFFNIKRIILISLLVLFHSAQAQNKGINFEHNSNWKSILSKARTQNKYIFVDCYTTWCGPCKFMSIQIFPQQKVGDFYNENYINVEYQLDSTGSDSPDIKSQYADAAYIRSKYKVVAYPTYLFFNPDGELVHQDLGAGNASEFIQKGMNGLDSNKQYYTLLKKYYAGQKDPIFLKKLTLLSLRSLNDSATSKFAKAYISTIPNLKDSEDLRFIYETTKSITDTGFNLMMKNLSKFEAVVGVKELNNTLKMIIFKNEFTKNDTHWGTWDNKKWNIYSNLLQKKYPLFAGDLLDFIKPTVFEGSGNWLSYAKTIEIIIGKHTLSNEQLNDYAWTVFRKCNEIKILKKALDWSKMSFENQLTPEPGYMDTYANLLYKIGKSKEALKWEVKAQQIAVKGGAKKDWGQDVIDKIKKGEKTW